MKDSTTKRHRLSKRHTLGRLATGWRESIFNSIRSDRLKLAVAVISATGCRPSELELGVVVRLSPAGQLTVGIQGTKVDAERHRGQPVRLLVVSDNTLWGSYLKEHATSADGVLMVKYDAEGVSQRLREKSRELWPRRSSLVSAYSYRHFMGRSMKESGVSADKIAATLGHASDFAQTAYGRAGGGKKTAEQHGVINAIAKNPIRHSPKTDRHLKFIKSDVNLIKRDRA